MKRQAAIVSDPDIQGSFPALKRAAQKAKELAKATGTPFYVVKNGRLVNLNPPRPRQRRSA